MDTQEQIKQNLLDIANLLSIDINSELQKENETLKITREKLLGDLYIAEESLKDYEEHYKRSEQEKAKYYQQTLDDEIQINELLQTLQEIKKIAEIKIDCKQYEIDHDCFNDTRRKAIRELIETLQDILDLITKSEVGE